MWVKRDILDSQLDKLPKEVKFCKKCVMSNQRPRITFDEDGVCSACNYAEKKDELINWEKRKDDFLKLMDKHRSNDGSYDVIVPCSGGKDSSTIAYRLKHEYGMHPLTVTFSPPIYSLLGWENLRRFIDSGYDHILYSPSGTVNRFMTKLGLILLGDHNEIFDHGQMGAPFRAAIDHNVKLVMYGENGEAEYGGSLKDAEKSGREWSDFDEAYYSASLDKLVNIGIEDGYLKEKPTKKMLELYTLPSIDKLKNMGVEMHWFGFYHSWIPQENFYCASEHTGFLPNSQRNCGTYSKYAQLDDYTDDFLYYLMFIKFGFGRATSDAAHEVRDGHLTREEAVALVHKYDGEFPNDEKFKTFLEYVDLTEDEFWDVVDRFRLPHIWKKENGEWKLRHQVV